LALASTLGFVDPETGDFPKSRAAFASDALATMFGSIFGLSPVTSYIESASGVEAGSRTGLTAVFCGFYFFLSIFFAPIIASIPPWATGGALIIVGALMCRSLGEIKWYDPRDSLTAFLTVILMPLTYSIAYGLIAGICCYAIMSAAYCLLEFVGIERPIFEAPVDDDPLEALVTKGEKEEEDEPGAVEADDTEDKPRNVATSSDDEPAPPTFEAEA